MRVNATSTCDRIQKQQQQQQTPPVNHLENKRQPEHRHYRIPIRDDVVDDDASQQRRRRRQQQRQQQQLFLPPPPPPPSPAAAAAAFKRNPVLFKVTRLYLFFLLIVSTTCFTTEALASWQPFGWHARCSRTPGSSFLLLLPQLLPSSSNNNNNKSSQQRRHCNYNNYSSSCGCRLGRHHHPVTDPCDSLSSSRCLSFQRQHQQQKHQHHLASIISLKAASSSSAVAAASSDNENMPPTFHRPARQRQGRRRLLGLLRRNHHHHLQKSLWFQLGLVLVVYTFHLLVLTQHQIVFPFQFLLTRTTSSTTSFTSSHNNNNNNWIPVYKHGVGIGYDSLAGMMTLLMYLVVGQKRQRQQQQQKQHQQQSKPRPWSFPMWQQETTSSTTTAAAADNNINSTTAATAATNTTTSIRFINFSNYNNTNNWPILVHRGTFLLTTTLLILAYFGTGRWSLFWEDVLYDMSAAGWPLTTPRFRAWTVLLGHLSWVGIGTALLALLPTAPRFFTAANIIPNNNNNVNDATTNGENSTLQEDAAVSSATANEQNTTDTTTLQPHRRRHWYWFQWKLRNQTWWNWVLGGYLVSSWLFNIADWANHYLLPPQVLLDSDASSVVSQLVAPEHNDWVASIVGYIAPCLSAPIWEEVLYRGFLLPALTHWTGNFTLSCILQAIVFSAHHMSVTAALPLAVLGWTWAVLYAWSGNLWTVCLVHALWNSRVFLGSWFGL